jgi:hypothetical protein
VDARKQRRIVRAAVELLARGGLPRFSRVRFDVVAIDAAAARRVTHIRDAFTADGLELEALPACSAQGADAVANCTTCTTEARRLNARARARCSASPRAGRSGPTSSGTRRSPASASSSASFTASRTSSRSRSGSSANGCSSRAAPRSSQPPPSAARALVKMPVESARR